MIAVPLTYKWCEVGLLAGVCLAGTMGLACFEARPVTPNYLGVGAMSASGGDSVLNDAYYDRIDWTDTDNTGTDAGDRNLGAAFPATPGVHYAPWEWGIPASSN